MKAPIYPKENPKKGGKQIRKNSWNQNKKNPKKNNREPNRESMAYLVCCPPVNLNSIPPKRIQNHISPQALVLILNQTLKHARPLLDRARQIAKTMELRTNLGRRAVDRTYKCTLAIAEVPSGGAGSGARRN